MPYPSHGVLGTASLAYARPIAFQNKRKALFNCFEQYNCMMCCCWLANNSTWISSSVI